MNYCMQRVILFNFRKYVFYDRPKIIRIGFKVVSGRLQLVASGITFEDKGNNP